MPRGVTKKAHIGEQVGKLSLFKISCFPFPFKCSLHFHLHVLHTKNVDFLEVREILSLVFIVMVPCPKFNLPIRYTYRWIASYMRVGLVLNIGVSVLGRVRVWKGL